MSAIQVPSSEKQSNRNHAKTMTAVAAVLPLSFIAVGTSAPAVAQEKKPNILVIMGDDVGWFNIGAYRREGWRFVFVQNVVSDLAKTAIEFPPMQGGRIN